MELPSWMISIIWGLSSILFAGNIFFIRRLVSKIDGDSNQRVSDHITVSNLHKEVTAIKDSLKSISDDIRDLRKIEIEVAVLKHQMRNSKDQG